MLHSDYRASGELLYLFLGCKQVGTPISHIDAQPVLVNTCTNPTSE